MKLDRETILELVEKPANTETIEKCKEIQDEHKIHVTGEGYDDYIPKIIGYENQDQYALKKELSEPATMALTKTIIDEQSRWEYVKETRKYYEFKNNKNLTKEFRNEVLNHVWKGETIEYFVKEFLKESLYTEFNGFVFVELPRIEKQGTTVWAIREGVRNLLKPKGKPQPYFIFKPIEDIRDFKIRGNKVEYIIFYYKTIIRDVEGSEKKIKLYRAIDDDYDYIIEEHGGEYTISEDLNYLPIKNTLGYVPVIQVSTKKQFVINDEIKTSPFSQTIPLLKTYLTNWSTHVISEIIHAYPKYWQIGQKCHYTEEGAKCEEGSITYELKGEQIDKECPNCKGTGAVMAKDTTTALILPQVDDEGRPFSLTEAGGYIAPPTDILSYQRGSLDALKEDILFSGTGIKKLSETKIEKTATEAILNYKPLENIIGGILDNIEYVETFLTDTCGKLYYKDTYEKSEIDYGRNLNLRDENTILQEIEQAKNSGVAFSYVRTLVKELLYSKYLHSQKDLERNLMLFELEPFVGYTSDEVMGKDGLYRVGLATKEETVMKINFNDYIVRFENENKRITDFKDNLEMKARLDAINKILKVYNDETLKKLRVAEDVNPDPKSFGNEA
jgi:hypothetical protein